MKEMGSEKKAKVAIQGIEGSYHHHAADLYFKDSFFEIEKCKSFREVTKAIENEKVDFGIMAIENSIAGTILPNYSLLFKHDLQIVGEVYIPISHQLLALPGTQLNQIKEVHSHPMALLQCDDFLEEHAKIIPVESTDTAFAAKQIKENKLTERAAIASKKSAEVYGLEILESDIQTIKKNSTRFLVLAKYGKMIIKEPNKASLRFRLRHNIGSLQEVLSELSNHRINLTKIQSIPVIESQWEYSFLIDVRWQNRQDYHNALQAILRKVKQLQIFGEYQSGK